MQDQKFHGTGNLAVGKHERKKDQSTQVVRSLRRSVRVTRLSTAAPQAVKAKLRSTPIAFSSFESLLLLWPTYSLIESNAMINFNLIDSRMDRSLFLWSRSSCLFGNLPENCAPELVADCDTYFGFEN